MEIVYYLDEDLKLCPVKKYLEQYLLSKSDGNKQREYKSNILTKIDEKIIFATENYRQQARFIRKLSGYGLIEIRQRKTQAVLIRIVYARYETMIVLLHAFEKPDNRRYTKKDKQALDKEISTAKQYFEKFKLNPNSYEEYV